MELFKRIIVALIFIPTLLFVYYKGGVILQVSLGILVALCAYEITKIFEHKNIHILFSNIALSLCLFYVIAVELDYALYILLIVLLLNGANDVFFSRLEGSVQRISGALLVVFYPAVCFGLLYRLNEFHSLLLPMLAVLIWLMDSCAYFIGMSLGKHRGLFKCSPKKSLEGFIAGFVSVFIVSLVVHFIYPEICQIKHVILFTVAVGIFGQFGDLLESIIKRDMEVKDSSHILPGHGGILDRFDSLMIAAPTMYIMMKIF
jgi:phosphatidate cytidylyltransferase